MSIKDRSKQNKEEIQRLFPPRDLDQEYYRHYFGDITDKYLIAVDYDNNKQSPKTGYIVYIDVDNDLDYADYREYADNDPVHKEMLRHIANLQLAEAVPTKHLDDNVQIEFKRILGAGYVHALNGNFDDIPDIIKCANDYLKKRNREKSRYLFLGSGILAPILASLAALTFYILHQCNVMELNPWYFGLIFGILGSYVSIWSRYGRGNRSGMGGRWLHVLECYSRIFIGMVFGVIAMVAIKCELILPTLRGQETLYAFILASFIASFSERFIPSIIEKLTNENDIEKSSVVYDSTDEKTSSDNSESRND